MNERTLNNTSNIDNIFGMIYGFGMFLLCMPYFMWETGKLNLLTFIVLALVSLYYFKKNTNTELFLLVLFLGIFIYSSINNNIIGFLIKLLLISFIILEENKMMSGLKWFKTIFVISLALSLITYVLVLILSVPLSYNMIHPLNALKSNYIQYPFLVSEHHLSLKMLYIRFFGMFDEPGVIGIFVTVLLVIDNYNFKSKQNIILFIAGILSFSLYFILCSIVFFFLTGSLKKRLFVIPIFIIFFLFTKDNLLLDNLVWDRLTIEDGQWKGDNRSSAGLNASYSSFLHSDDLLWGKGQNYLRSYGETGNSSYKELVMTYGLVFLIFLCISFILFAYIHIRNRKYFFLFLLLFFGMIYQRPFIFDPAYFFIYIAAILKFKEISLIDIYTPNDTFTSRTVQ